MQGWGLCSHPDLLQGTLPGQKKMKDYIFSPMNRMSLSMSEHEQQVIVNCFREIKGRIDIY